MSAGRYSRATKPLWAMVFIATTHEYEAVLDNNTNGSEVDQRYA